MIGLDRPTLGSRQDIQMFKSDQGKQVDANLMKKHYGDKDIGQILNEVADPNFAQNKKARTPNNKMGKEAFLKLLLTQLQNQDPMSPLESHDMAAQLAQFTSLEKLDGIDSGINKLSQSNGKKTSFESLELIGKEVSGDSSKIIRNALGDEHEISFNLKTPAQKVRVEVLNSVGETVFQNELMNIDKGKHSINWNGISPNGVDAPLGGYNVVINAVDNRGANVPVNTQFTGKVTGVNFTARGPVLLVGKKQIPLAEVKTIQLPQAGNVPVRHAPTQGQALDPNQLNRKLTKQNMVPESGATRANPLKNISTLESLKNGPLSKMNLSTEMINKINNTLKK